METIVNTNLTVSAELSDGTVIRKRENQTVSTPLCSQEGQNHCGQHFSALEIEWTPTRFNQAQLYPLLARGSLRMRRPVAVKIALQTAGKTGGNAGSPNPVGGNSVLLKWTSISGGA